MTVVERTSGIPRVDRAMARADADVAGRWSERQWSFGQPDGRPRARRLAIGDPQAPLPTLLEILDRHGALGDDGRLVPDVLLVSMGDHFDWGGGPGQVPAEELSGYRDEAASDGLRFLAWLAAHPADQVIILAGNHDLGRVGELAGVGDGRFERAQAEADDLYGAGDVDPQREADFAERYGLPTAELVARDFSTYREVQAELVGQLLLQARMCAAWAASPSLLLTHAGVTAADLRAAGLASRSYADAPAIAAALQAALALAVDRWPGPDVPLTVPGLHQPGTPGEEGRGIFFHRPSNPERGKDRAHPELFAGPVRRRFDPRDLPLGLVQAIGHIHDKKCRELLAGWTDDTPPTFGPLRHLTTDGARVRYALGVPRTIVPAAATLLFLDGKAHEADVARYELLDLDRLAPAARRG